MVPCSPEIGLRPAASILKSVGRLLATYENALAPTRLTTTSFVILGEIKARKSNPPQIVELVRTLSVDRPRLNRSLRALERDGFVCIVTHGKGHCSKQVELTSAGLVNFRQAKPLWKHAQMQLDAVFGKQIVADLRDTLSLLASLASSLP